MFDKMNLSANQKVVLGKLEETIAVGKTLMIRDFADVATVTTGRMEWAKDPLSALLAKGLVEFDEGTGRRKNWRITLAGCEQLVLARASA